MIKWTDEAIILGVKAHGERNAIVEVFSHNHGRYFGLARGRVSAKRAAPFQAGQVAQVEYTARLENHLGQIRIETLESFAARLILNPSYLLAFNAASSMLRFGTYERDPHQALFQSFYALMKSPDWQELLANYVQFELTLLKEAGFRLQLEKCAVTGNIENLSYISPKSGAAISAEAAGEWADRLLPYSPLFQGRSANAKDLRMALEATEYFLQNWLGGLSGKSELPQSRRRLIEKLQNGDKQNSGAS